MRYPPEQNERTRAGIVAAAGQTFREKGYDGVGVDVLAARAKLTVGGLYKHFGSKGMLFQEVVRVGMERLQAGILQFQAQKAGDWLAALAGWYMGPGHRADIGGGCAMPSLSPEVVKSDEKTRAVYEAGLLQAFDALIAEPPFRDAERGRECAWASLALLAGGVALSRAVVDPALADEIAVAVKNAVQDGPAR